MPELPQIPIRVLFICAGPGIRAMIAERYLGALSEGGIYGFSARFEDCTFRTVPKLIQNIMEKDNLPLHQACPTSIFDRFRNKEHFDYVVSLCMAMDDHTCPVFLANVDTMYSKVAQRISWNVPDFRNLQDIPGEERIPTAIAIRDQIKSNVQALIQQVVN